MINQNLCGQLVIRRATRNDEKELAELAYVAYFDRFFNDAVTDKFGASLKVYPELIPDEENDTGQSRSTFADYWNKAMQNLNNPQKQFLCFVAEIQSSEGSKIVGFRKGYAAPLEPDEYALYQKENTRRNLLRKKYAYQRRNVSEDLSPINLPAYEKIAGSTIVPVRLLGGGRYIKLVIAVGKGKKKYDKRETIKKRDLDRGRF